MAEHSPEPWTVDHEYFINDANGQFVCDIDGLVDEGLNRRIVACVNACAIRYRSKHPRSSVPVDVLIVTPVEPLPASLDDFISAGELLLSRESLQQVS